MAALSEGAELELTTQELVVLQRHWQEDMWLRFHSTMEAGDWQEAFKWLGSEHVAKGLVEAAEYLSREQRRDLLADQWDSCDGSGREFASLLDLWRSVAPPTLSDTGRLFEGAVTIYRGNLGEDPRLGLSWTLSRAAATRFALYAFASPRAAWLGLQRSGEGESVPTVWCAAVSPSGILGYIGKRRESEVIPDPDLLRDVRVCELVPVRSRRIGVKRSGPGGDPGLE